MHRNLPYIIVGFLIALTPFLGFPASWETSLIVILGFYIGGRALLKALRERYKPGILDNVKVVEETPDHNVAENTQSGGTPS